MIKKIIKILDSKSLLYFIFFVLGIMAIITFMGIVLGRIQASDDDNFCKLNYPSEIKSHFYLNSWSNLEDAIEPGYINCCRHYFLNHIMMKECKIFQRPAQ